MFSGSSGTQTNGLELPPNSNQIQPENNIPKMYNTSEIKASNLHFFNSSGYSNQIYFSPENISTPISVHCNQHKCQTIILPNSFDISNSFLGSPYSQSITDRSSQPISNEYSQPIRDQFFQPIDDQFCQAITDQNNQPISNLYTQSISNHYPQPINGQNSIDKLTSSVFPRPTQSNTPSPHATPLDTSTVPETRRRIAHYASNVDESLYQNQYTNEKALRNSGTELSSPIYGSGSIPSPKTSIFSNPYCSPMVARQLLSYQQNSSHSLVRTRYMSLDDIKEAAEQEEKQPEELLMDTNKDFINRSQTLGSRMKLRWKTVKKALSRGSSLRKLAGKKGRRTRWIDCKILIHFSEYRTLVIVIIMQTKIL